MNDITVTIYVPCRDCGQLRTLRVHPSPESMRRAFYDHSCRNCANTGTAAAAATQLADEIAWMRVPPDVAARRLGTTVGALARRFHRAGLHDAARPFQRAHTRQRKQRKAAA